MGYIDAGIQPRCSARNKTVGCKYREALNVTGHVHCIVHNTTCIFHPNFSYLANKTCEICDEFQRSMEEEATKGGKAMNERMKIAKAATKETGKAVTRTGGKKATGTQ